MRPVQSLDVVRSECLALVIGLENPSPHDTHRETIRRLAELDLARGLSPYLILKPDYRGLFGQA